ncbi:SCO family protein [Alkalilimnicola ehrlichii MLHE-1]|uniref:Electron transport protein SCO1/SenC n=1 Tax=Alkalilimnicola ehrlichii (strain ATCC BAA-1101 / DSM 17681 / MLHE-1) TaxID=187272 RepID=Q0AAB8_ALKEH|nr:SCO family protein [Alkalilimnicola ehrlichii]ABI56219.1 electron transport protein SCO1/SenC [Alkalilimnicola ehrlichii MLHE-1]
MRSVFGWVLVAVVAVGGGALSAAWMGAGTPEPPETEATWLEGGRAITPFELVDQHERPFDNRRLEGQWTFMFFGFTHCPDICPMSLAAMNRIETLLAETGDDEDLQVVFVSVDPDRDTPERLKEYVGWFGEDYLGVTGEMDKVEVLTRNLGIVHARHDTGGGEYQIDHSAQFLLINPGGHLQAIFPYPHAPESIVADFRQMRAYHEG